MTTAIQKLVYKMMIENTGRSMGDSGDYYGRNWQQNAGKTIEDFINAPEAVLEVSSYKEGSYEFSPTINLFHKLTKTLSLDDLCDEFNAMEVGNWNGEFYGTDQGQCDWLLENGFTADGGGFNSYNGDSLLSQIIQGQFLDRDGDKYVLLQVHGGCDARAGYTDARLFLVEDEYPFIDESCGFYLNEQSFYANVSGEWSDSEGNYYNRDDLNELGKIIGVGKFDGDLFN